MKRRTDRILSWALALGCVAALVMFFVLALKAGDEDIYYVGVGFSRSYGNRIACLILGVNGVVLNTLACVSVTDEDDDGPLLAHAMVAIVFACVTLALLIETITVWIAQ